MVSASDVERKAKRFGRFVSSPRRFFESEYQSGDGGFAVSRINTSFLHDPVFEGAWENARLLNKEGWASQGSVPDIRWRAHVACWAASSALRACAGGDLAEFGVHTGIISLMLCRATDFIERGRKLYLFDTFDGIPELDSLSDTDAIRAREHNASLYFDCYKLVERNFKEYGNSVEIVRGILPDTLEDAEIKTLCFAHIDLNNAPAEMAVIERIWDRILPSGMILLDDYGWTAYKPQYDAWNDFCDRMGHRILTLPTGQGLIMKGLGTAA